MRREGLPSVNPFHSFAGGPHFKRFPHCCVLPRHVFNTNCDDPPPPAAQSATADGAVASPVEQKGETGDELPPWAAGTEPWARFIFHPAGRKGKLGLIRQVLLQRGIPFPGTHCSAESHPVLTVPDLSEEADDTGEKAQSE